MYKNWNWEALGGIAALLALLGKGVQFVWKRFDNLVKENKELHDKVEELRILSAKQAAVLKMTSSYLKETIADDLQTFVDKTEE